MKKNKISSMINDKPKSRVYLAGAGDEIGYRQYAKEKYSDYFELIDPMTSDAHRNLELKDPNRVPLS